MAFPTRVIRALAPLLLLAPLPSAAQQQAQPSLPAPAASSPAPQYARPDDPWIFRDTDIPVDPKWLFGEMPNGLRYAVRHNAVPPGQVSIRIRIDAGSLHERDSEQGFAHLIEHLTFRQSKYLGDGEAIPKWQRLGATFGSDTNAETSPTHTVYKLDLPNARHESLEESVKLLSGMIREPALSAANLTADVPIVLAERRERTGAAMRVATATRETLFAGQPLAERAPIGTLETLQGATPQAVRAFHQRWYRPENTVVVAVGDADPMLLAALVERYFSDWNAPGTPAPEPDFGAPTAPDDAGEGLPVGETQVLVEPGQPRGLTYAYLRPYVQVIDNLEYNRGKLIDAVGLAIINRRLEAQARKGASYLYGAVENEDVSRSANGTFVALAPLSKDWRAALADVRSVIADALAQPPTQEEIDREAAELEVIFANQVEQSAVEAGAKLADDLVNAVDIREAVGTPDLFLEVFRSMQDRLTPEAVFEHTRKLFDATVVRAIYLTPAIGEADAADIAAALRETPEVNGNLRIAAQQISFADLPPVGAPAAPVSRVRTGIHEVEQLSYANGVRALVWNSGNEPGRVTVRVRFGSGWRAFSGADAVHAWLGQMALVGAGVGPLDQEQLDRITTGRKMGFQFEIKDGAFVFQGQTRQADLADQLYLFAAKLATPRWDENPFERARASARLAYDSHGSTPAGVLRRDLEWLLNDRDPRFATPTPQMLEQATPDGFRKVWEPLLAQGPVEVAVFGDIDTEATVQMLNRTFGALPQREPIPPAALTRDVGFPAAGGDPIVLHHSGDAEQGAAVIAWPTGGGSASLPESRKLELLAEIFSNRLLDSMREHAGASYAPQVSSSWPLDLASGGRILAVGQIPPQLMPQFFEEAESIAADLAANGPTPDELERAAEPLRQLLQRVQTGHTFWLNQLEGATTDPNRIVYLPSLFSDYTRSSPAEMQALAAKYLRPDKALQIQVVPED